jgi:hypothetical protein
MLNSGKKIRALRDKKIIILTLVLSEKKYLNETKNHNSPLQVKWTVPNLVHLQNSKYYFRYNNILDIPQVRTSRYGKQTFKFAAATLWNSLPDHFRTENSFSQFKSLMQSWNGTNWCCSACI